MMCLKGRHKAKPLRRSRRSVSSSAKLRRAAVRGVMKNSWGVCVQKGVRAESSAGRRPRGVSAIRDNARRRPQEGLCDPCSPGVSVVVASVLRLGRLGDALDVVVVESRVDAIKKTYTLSQFAVHQPPRNGGPSTEECG